MSKTRKRNPITGQGRRLLHTYLPTATARAVTVFTPVNGEHDRPVAVELADYGIVTVIQVTSLSTAPLAVRDVIVNGEFHPVISVGDLKRLFLVIQWHRQMSYGASFHAVVRAPGVVANVQARCCYPKPPTSITVSTSLGDFEFAMGEVILPE